MSEELVIDFFAGCGGASSGIRAALGREVDLAVNHWGAALEVHERNHPGARHLIEDVFAVKPAAATGGRPVGLMWLSPDCKHFSKAKGGKPVDKRIRGLAWLAVKWAKAVRPRVIILENVEEFRDWGPLLKKARNSKLEVRREEKNSDRKGAKDAKKAGEGFEWVPDPARKGMTYRQFCGRLRGLGYQVEDRVLVAADYGAPTTRKRLFLIARCDGAPIVWPEPTHEKRISTAKTQRPQRREDLPRRHGDTEQADLFGGKKLAWRAAAECIDWSIPCPSIFERKRPLAENTLRRIAEGIRRYVIECKEPFIVNTAHGAGGGAINRRGRGDASILDPLGTTTGSPDRALVMPYMTQYHSAKREGDDRTADAAAPLPTQTTENRFALVEAFLAKFRGQSAGGSLREPAPTITSGAGAKRPAGAAHALGIVTPYLTKICQQGSSGGKTSSVEEPAKTIVSKNEDLLIAPTLVQTGYGERAGQAPRALDLGKPLGTVVGGGGKHAIAAAHLTKFYGTNVGADLREPAPTITANGQHIAEVRAFLVTYYGQGTGQRLRDPLRTVTTKDRMGLVTIDGVEWQIADIGLRMLAPRELARAQGFDESYWLPANKSLAVALIGNSVPPPLAEALVRANCPELIAQEAAA